MSTSKELNVLKQLFEDLSDAEKNAFLNSLNSTSSPKQSIDLCPKEMSVCPHCGATHIVKNGIERGSQRYLCRDCHKSFVTASGTILYKTQKELAVWQKYIQCMIDKFSLRRCADECGISLPTAFAWRHKILDALLNITKHPYELHP